MTEFDVSKPSSLLWDDEIGQPASILKVRCDQLLKNPSYGSLELLAQDAEDLYTHGNPCDYAVILIHLADLYRRLGKLGPALKCSEKAKQHFCCLPEIRQRHNRGVALYSLGLINQLLGSEREALACYDEAASELAKAKEYWVLCNDSDSIALCEGTIDRIGQLRNYVARARTWGGTSALNCSILVECGSTDADVSYTDQPLIDVQLAGIVLKMHLRLKDRILQLELHDGNEMIQISVEPDTEYYVLLDDMTIQELPTAAPADADSLQVRIIGGDDLDDDAEEKILGILKKAA